LGQIEKAWVDNDQFRVSGTLDADSEEAQRLYQRLQAGKRYGLSVGGRVLKAHWEHDEEAGRTVKHIDDVELDHIALCRPSEAANPDTYLTALAKAADAVIGDAPETAEGHAEVLPEPEGDKAAFARVGRSLVEACQRLWPFGAQPALAKSEDVEDDAADPEALKTRIEELSGSVQALEDAVDTLQKADETADEAIEPGRPQAILGQSVTERTGNTWKGVL
jgi:cell division septum initiation protein DivIVA